MKVNIICPEDAVRRLVNCLPGGDAKIGNIIFSFNNRDEYYDGIVVLQSTSSYDYDALYFREGNSLLIVREPQDILRMPSRYINQFDHVLTPNRKVKGKHTINAQFGQLWTFNKNFDMLVAEPPPRKILNLSTVTSLKANTQGHKKRLELLKLIKKELGNDFDWYGRGVRPVEDKWDAIAPYCYHLVFENGQWPDYWTEKLAEAYLGFSMPIYVGCTNIQDYFSKESLAILDDLTLAHVIRKLADLLEGDVYTKAFASIVDARNMLLQEYSFFKILVKLINENFSNGNVAHKMVRLSEFSNTAYLYNPKKLLKHILNVSRSK
jgi:hypothetical protein